MAEISIIVPIYNSREVLLRCVDSLLAQTFQDFDIWLIDDGSSDGSAAIADRLALEHDRITTVHQENRGLGAARNTGLLRSRSTYVAFVDSDDSIDPTMLQALHKATVSASADIATCEARRVEYDETGREHEEGMLSFPFDETTLSGIQAASFQLDLIDPTLNSVCFKLIRRSLFMDNLIQFPEAKRFAEDTPTSTRLFLSSKTVAFVHQPLYHYTIASRSLTSSYSLSNASDLLLDLADMCGAMHSVNPLFDTSNCIFNMLFSVEKQIAWASDSLADRTEEKQLRQLIADLKENRRPNLTDPRLTPFAKAKIAVSYLNLVPFACRWIEWLSFLPAINRLL